MHISFHRINPYAEDHYDGVSLNPMEVLFVKVKEFMLVANWVGPRQASRYDEWTNTKVSNVSWGEKSLKKCSMCTPIMLTNRPAAVNTHPTFLTTTTTGAHRHC